MNSWLEQLLDQWPIAHLGTVSDERPHLVPVVFVRIKSSVAIPIDGKPKTGSPLRRLTNIEENPKVSLLLDSYSEDWSSLWWVRLDGRASIESTSQIVHEALESKYPQYRSVSTGNLYILIEITNDSKWCASNQAPWKSDSYDGAEAL